MPAQHIKNSIGLFASNACKALYGQVIDALSPLEIHGRPAQSLPAWWASVACHSLAMLAALTAATAATPAAATNPQTPCVALPQPPRDPVGLDGGAGLNPVGDVTPGDRHRSDGFIRPRLASSQPAVVLALP